MNPSMQKETTDTTVALHSARHVLLCATDHESAASTNLLVDQVKDAGFHVKIIIASGAKPFVKHQLLDQSLDDEQEWYAWQKVGDEVMHIELTRWADLLVISPCSANYLAKIANGLCDDLVMSVVRAWPPDQPVLLQLAMHTSMWQHPVTSQQLAVLNMQPNLHFVGTKNCVLQSVDHKSFQPDYGASCISSVVAAIQKLVGSAPHANKQCSR